MEFLLPIAALVVSLVVLCWLWDCKRASQHCAWQLDKILAELRAMRQGSAPKPEEVKPGFCVQCGQPAVRVVEMGREVSVCPQCGAKV